MITDLPINKYFSVLLDLSFSLVALSQPYGIQLLFGVAYYDEIPPLRSS